jgi:hypothetical protein
MIDQLGQGAWDVAKRGFEEAEERTAIRLTRAIKALPGGAK